MNIVRQAVIATIIQIVSIIIWWIAVNPWVGLLMGMLLAVLFHTAVFLKFHYGQKQKDRQVEEAIFTRYPSRDREDP